MDVRVKLFLCRACHLSGKIIAALFKIIILIKAGRSWCQQHRVTGCGLGAGAGHRHRHRGAHLSLAGQLHGKNCRLATNHIGLAHAAQRRLHRLQATVFLQATADPANVVKRLQSFGSTVRFGNVKVNECAR